MNGIKVDSTLPGIKPFRLCIEGKLLHVWEVPFSVCDSRNFRGIPFNIANNIGKIFSDGINPIVGVFHPHNKHTFQWKIFINI